jgi:hypothetical protein
MGISLFAVSSVILLLGFLPHVFAFSTDQAAGGRSPPTTGN